MLISIDASDTSFKNTERFLGKVSKLDFMDAVRSVARDGVNALSVRTPHESGLTGASWGYEIAITKGSTTITWTNSHTINGVNIAVILQMGHGTGTGGWVAGRDYINPAIQPIMNTIANRLWKVVTSA